jgi:hypothetical protein
MFPRNGTSTNLQVVRSLREHFVKGKIHFDDLVMSQYVSKISWPDEAFETNLCTKDQRDRH